MEDFTLSMVSGQLQLRGAEPFALENPTRITGTNTDGQLSGVELSTPTVTTERDAPDYNTTAEIDAAFSMIEAGVGTINEQRHMTVQVKLAVDLHIVVPILPGSSDCRAAPIVLTLTSTAPHDEASGEVTLRAPNFSVPPIVGSAQCNGLLVKPVNEALAGSGHSLTLTMKGDITAPTAGEPTATTLAVSPGDRADLGDAVTLIATVVPNPAVPGAPPVSGVVTFTNDGIPVGSAQVQGDGTATLTATDLPAGSLQLQAVYGGAPPDWDPSSSPIVPYTVMAPPFVSTDIAGEIRIGGSPKDFDVTVHNTGYGTDLEDARLEVTIRRPSVDHWNPIAPIGPGSANPRIVLSRVVNGVATPIPLPTMVPFPPSLAGEIGDASTWSVPAGEEHTETLRLQVNAGTEIGPLAIDFTLVTGAGASEVTLGTTTGEITMVTEARLPSVINSGFPGFFPFFPDGVPVTTRVRQGNTAELEALRIDSIVGGVKATGTWSFAVDGVPVLGQHVDLHQSGVFQWLTSVPLSTSSTSSPRVLLKIPRTVPVGVHQVTVRYSGDAIYAPAHRTWPITVEAATGTLYECVASSVVPVRFTADVEVEGAVPSLWPVGRELPVDRVQVRLNISRTSAQENVLASINEEGRDWRLDVDPGGTINPATVTSANNLVMVLDDPNTPEDETGPTDHQIDLTDGTGAITVTPTPGAASAYTLDTINVTATPSGFSTGFLCTPADEPHSFGTITSAGTTLTVDPGEVVGGGRNVALTASALPAMPGVVEFRDGTTTIGVVPVDSTGTARMTTDDLPVGARSLTARFFGGLIGMLPSAPVELRVATCGAASEPGNGAVARLVYLELLGRCPDAAGYEYWVDRLDGGTSREAFARSMARTPEAVGRVVDDAYQAMLGRPADAAGRAFWTRRLQASGRYDQLLADLAASTEFWSKSGSTDGGTVTRIYERLLDRSPDQGGFDFWVGRLEDGTSRRALVLTLANQSEPLGALVDDAYDEILDRKPTAAEGTEGIAFLRSTGDRSGLYARLIGTQELHDRAQGLPDPA